MTNRELAKILGVSPATLSLVLNNKYGISDETRTRLLERIEELGFSGLVKKEETKLSKDRNICFVVYKRSGIILDSSPFFLLIMEGVQSCALKHGYNLLFLSIDRRNPMDDQMQQLNTMNCKGIVIFATEMTEEDLSYLSKLTIPYVILDNDFPNRDMDCVAINNSLGTYQAVSNLVSQGHTQIGYLKSNDRINSFEERQAGFVNALGEFGLSLEPKYIFPLNYSEEGSYQDMKKILTGNVELPSAFFSDDDTIAVGAMKALIEAGITIPHDISVIGFNDRPICEYCVPALTSIRVPKYSFGAMAIELLVMRIDDAKIEQDAISSFKYRVGTELVSRASVAHK